MGAAGADGWITLLEFPGTAPEWTETDEKLLSAGLENYRCHGVDVDRDNLWVRSSHGENHA